jgi:hypothetical protein
MTEEEKKEKKIIIDEDWKREAQREKEVLAAREQEEKQEQATEEPRHGRLPQGDLAGLINMLTTQALFALGLLRLKGEEQREPDLELARYNIDMIQALEEKTQGNLTPEEQQVLKNTLSDLRMGYVNVTNQLASQ